jgi:hypothetical protein
MKARSKRSDLEARSPHRRRLLSTLSVRSSQQLHDTPVGIACVAVSPDRLASSSSLAASTAPRSFSTTAQAARSRPSSSATRRASTRSPSASRRLSPARPTAPCASGGTARPEGGAFEETLRISTPPRRGDRGRPCTRCRPGRRALGVQRRHVGAARHRRRQRQRRCRCSPTLANVADFELARFHPDGLLVGAGDAHGVAVRCLISARARAPSRSTRTRPASTAVAFSENALLWWRRAAPATACCEAVGPAQVQVPAHGASLEAGYAVRSLAV